MNTFPSGITVCSNPASRNWFDGWCVKDARGKVLKVLPSEADAVTYAEKLASESQEPYLGPPPEPLDRIPSGWRNNHGCSVGVTLIRYTDTTITMVWGRNLQDAIRQAREKDKELDPKA